MNNTIYVLAFLVLFLSACNESVVVPINRANAVAIDTSKSEPPKSNGDDEPWFGPPKLIEVCLSKADPLEEIKVERLFNPYYLRADLNKDGVLEYVVLVRSVKNDRRRGILICSNSTSPVVLGSISKEKAPFSTLSDDNFVTDNWEVLSSEESKRVATDAKGEIIGFFYEGGAFFVYWNGKIYRGLEGA